MITGSVGNGIPFALIALIELTQADLEFKKSADFQGKKDNLLEVAYILREFITQTVLSKIR